MTRLLTIATLLALLACEHIGEQPEPRLRSKRESAVGLLRVELQLAALEDFLQHGPDVPDGRVRLEEVRFLRAHIARCERWLAETETDRRRLATAHVGLDLAGVGYDLVRVDLEATLRHLGGLARRSSNTGLEAIWRGIRSLERDPSTATSREMTAHLLLAEEQRDTLLATVPRANVLRPGVLAASHTSSAYSLAKAAMAAGPVLGRLAGFLTNPAGAAVGVEVSAGGAAAVSVVASGGALVLTEVEVIALAQAGALSATAIQLAMMANGRPPKVPDPRRFAEWVKQAPARPAQRPDTEPTRFQVKYAGPVERLLQATSGERVWADGVREADCRILEAKLVTKPETSPYVRAWKEVHEWMRADVRNEFIRYAAIIRDPASPAVALEVITNEARAVPFFESVLKELGIPGQVVVRPFP